MPPALRVLTSQPHFLYATWMNVSICVWSDAPRVTDFQRAVPTIAELAREYPGGVASIAIVTGGNLPSPEARKALTDGLSQIRQNIMAICGVIDVPGFGGATLRAMMAGLVLVSRDSVPRLICADVTEAGTWLAPRINPLLRARVTSLDVAEALREAQSQHIAKR